MRIGRFRTDSSARIGVFENDHVRDVSSEFDSFREALSRPSDARDASEHTFDAEQITLLPPTTSRNTVYCAGLNYKAHADESKSAIPERPLIFMKLPQTLVGHRQGIAFHSQVTEEIDYEGELAAVIGRTARHVSPENAIDHVAGYTILNDTSARDLQLSFQVGDDELFDWFSGKTMTNTTPCGPFVVTEEIEDPQNLDISSRVNGETMQDDNTQNMIRSVADIVSYVSTRVRLEPGDIIATGTPEGVGTFQNILLHPGDTIEVEIEGIGTLANTVIEADVG